ncbi:transmembrane protein 11, mitochondrial [Adelges cooleyi]|uniref:transmembrane protein 11, mitochondrial n=1 Tax=Adelges cooleyi TaxID=133065 RepID=UPI00217FC61B|nr:transmembrane protein 11, mitochondrial [Adelges cooleyi]XP_050435744.1 transmembrane protein 11, mitochondrial [Adelges cooleyi]
MLSYEIINQEDTAIIREVYDNDNSQEIFEQELDNALEAGYKYIIIEPTQLADETVRWITVGNCISKIAILTGTLSIGIAYPWSSKPLIYGPLCMVSFVCTGLYMVSWQFDPCCKYQVHRDPRLKSLQKEDNTPPLPVVIERGSDTKRKIVHTTVTTASIAYCIWKLYEYCK